LRRFIDISSRGAPPDPRAAAPVAGFLCRAARVPFVAHALRDRLAACPAAQLANNQARVSTLPSSQRHSVLLNPNYDRCVGLRLGLVGKGIRGGLRVVRGPPPLRMQWVMG